MPEDAQTHREAEEEKEVTTTALATQNQLRDGRDPARASGRLRRAAEHYVKSGCRAIGPSMVWAGYSQMTAREPTKNGYTHDWLVSVARYWNKGTQEVARAHLGAAIRALAEMVHDPMIAPQARGAAAKTIIDVAAKEREKESTAEVSEEEQAKWMILIRHQKRALLRRGILLGIAANDNFEAPDPDHRAFMLLERLNYLLGKGPRPEGWEEEDGDSGVQRPEGDSRHDSYIEAEVVEEQRAEPTGDDDRHMDTADPGAGSTDPE